MEREKSVRIWNILKMVESDTLTNYSSTVTTASLTVNIRMQHKNRPKKELHLKSEHEESKMEILKILTLHTILPNPTQVSLGYRSQQTEQLWEIASDFSITISTVRLKQFHNQWERQMVFFKCFGFRKLALIPGQYVSHNVFNVNENVITLFQNVQPTECLRSKTRTSENTHSMSTSNYLCAYSFHPAHPLIIEHVIGKDTT